MGCNSLKYSTLLYIYIIFFQAHTNVTLSTKPYICLNKLIHAIRQVTAFVLHAFLFNTIFCINNSLTIINVGKVFFKEIIYTFASGIYFYKNFLVASIIPFSDIGTIEYMPNTLTL